MKVKVASDEELSSSMAVASSNSSDVVM